MKENFMMRIDTEVLEKLRKVSKEIDMPISSILELGARMLVDQKSGYKQMNSLFGLLFSQVKENWQVSLKKREKV